MGVHKLGKLAPVALKSLRDGWHSDGGNLYLFVRGNSRVWVFRYVAPDGARRNMGLGPQHSVSLAAARKVASALREQIKHPTEPIDPLAARRDARLAQEVDRRKQITFKACALSYIEAHRAEWKNPKHTQQWENTLTTYAYPVIGELPVASIDDTLVLKVLLPIWQAKTETASRLRGRIESILAWATFNKFRHGENPARWKGHLDNSLAKPNRIARIKHHPALPYTQIGSFMAELRMREGISAKALEFAILTAARSGEVRGVTWGEIDIANRLWIVPAERMKAEKEHKVPLSDAAVTLLEALTPENDASLVFPGAVLGKPMSDMSLSAVLRRMGRTGLTVHGFRSTFRDWAAEATSYPSEMAEMALAHTIGDKVEAAYRRGDMLLKRYRMMNDWATYCATIRSVDAAIVPLRGAA